MPEYILLCSIINAVDRNISNPHVTYIQVGERPVGILAKVRWTLANWRKYWGYIGESPVDIRQLANVGEVYWRNYSGLSPLANVQLAKVLLAKFG